MERLDIDAMRALLAIQSQGGVTRAADHLALSQSAVSHKIRRLEQTLDCQLLSRRPGAPLFTDAGQRLSDYAQRIVALHDEALTALARKPVSGTIQLGLTEDTATSAIARVLGRFTHAYRDIQVRIRTSQSLTVQSWLRGGELDAAVMQVFDADVQTTDLVLSHDSLHWVRSPDFTFDPSRPVPFLSFDENCFFRRWGFDAGTAFGHRFEKVLECPSAAGIQSAIRAGLGVALLNGQHVTRDMYVIKDVFPHPPDLTYLVRLRQGRPTPALNALVSEIARETQGPAAQTA